MKNVLIDALDGLLHPQGQTGRWEAARNLAQHIGVKSILVADINGSLKQIRWMNTDMPASWMEHYISESYVEVDPFVEGLNARSGSMQLDCGVLRRDQAGTDREWSLNHGMKDAGFDGMHCARYGADTGLGKYVTLAFESQMDRAHAATPVELQLFSALLASTIGEDTPPDLQRFAPPPDPVLTQRQREVLSLLAEGLMTARIAEKLGLSQAAVTMHFANARKALGASTREHALALALSRGLISL